MIPETAPTSRRRTSESAVDIAHTCPPAILDALRSARAALASEDVSLAQIALAAEAAEMVGGLTDDAGLALAVLGQGALAAGKSPESLTRTLGESARSGAEELQTLVALDLGAARATDAPPDATRTEALRKMLLAVVSDPRLVVARLAIALVQLRTAKLASADERRRLAEATRAIFAPLANRLGLWQLKWELEDLAFRYLEPEDYKLIATALAEKRADRERYIADLCARIVRELAAVGVTADVHGRPKHLYSIYRKMRRKNLAFEDLFDVRAVRIVVATVADCYAALGLVHSRWPYIAGEFDDYIATPKDNFYRSIHTAVVGPEGKPVEVQIRTAEMHAHSELGLAAHWRYKEGGSRDADYERKIEWVRRLLEPAEGSEEFLDRVRVELFEDRVYALTPKGEVIDLVRGATPLDFAYQVHTDLGHRTRGAKVNGRIVPLSYALQSGEVVEIITHKLAAPSRDWLSPDAKVLISPRSRSKVRAWFRRQSEAEGTVEAAATTPPPPLPRPRRRRLRSNLVPVAIEGLDDLPITLARCCAPVRPQPIVGYVTVGRGVTVHRAGCPGLARMRAAHPERALLARWTDDESRLLDVEVTIESWDRHGLVRDLTEVLASERLSIDSMSTTTVRDQGTARTVLRFGIAHLDSLARIEQRLRGISAVTAVRRSG